MTQLSLFGSDQRATLAVRAAAPSEDLVKLAAAMPPTLAMGTSSWSFPGWRGLVWGDRSPTKPLYTEATLAREGLATYAQHPLLRAVGLDRSHYAPVTTTQLAAYRAAAPAPFRFVMKAHEAITLAQFPTHPRYGAHRGQASPYFLDPAYARDVVVQPFCEGLGAGAHILLFQFAAQPLAQLGGSPTGFADALHRFLTALPPLPPGSRYAVEVRNANLLTPRYAQALHAASAVHCHTLLPTMPSLSQQRALVGPQAHLLVRWMLAPGHTYESALAAFGDFSAIVAPDYLARREILDAVTWAQQLPVDATVIVNNKAEGSSPLSIHALAHAWRNRLDDRVPF